MELELYVLFAHNSLLGLYVYTFLVLGCIFLGSLFLWWVRKAEIISTIWYYQTALFWAIAYTKTYDAIGKYLRCCGDHVGFNKFIRTFLWNTKDVPLLSVILVFVVVVSWRTFIVRKNKGFLFSFKREKEV
uniref:Uncharacterized protein n=1 Tax=viral metagenome TaxID=1070528 RepID=A0A6M3XIK7_9ZZZZ